MTSLADWRLLSRPGCHLCDEFLSELTVLLPAAATIQRCNVDARDEWRAAFGRRIPVLIDAAGGVLYAADAPVPLQKILAVAKLRSAE